MFQTEVMSLSLMNNNYDHCNTAMTACQSVLLCLALYMHMKADSLYFIIADGRMLVWTGIAQNHCSRACSRSSYFLYTIYYLLFFIFGSLMIIARGKKCATVYTKVTLLPPTE